VWNPNPIPSINP